MFCKLNLKSTIGLDFASLCYQFEDLQLDHLSQYFSCENNVNWKVLSFFCHCDRAGLRTCSKSSYKWPNYDQWWQMERKKVFSLCVSHAVYLNMEQKHGKLLTFALTIFMKIFYFKIQTPIWVLINVICAFTEVFSDSNM